MSPEDRRQALEMFDRALLLPAGERGAFLEDACSDSDALRREVESLLAVNDDAAGFLDQPLLPLPTPPDGGLGGARRIGRYRIERQLGEGGMGTVYLAERDEPGFKVQAAIKMIRPGKDGEEIVSRFRREQEILTRLDHPNIAKPFDRGTTADGLPYLVMEYVQGAPIDDYCDSNKLSTAERLRLFRKVCSAVHFAHQNLVIHRDLKPANILVTPQGEPKLLDFGVAGLVNPSPFSTRAETLHQTTGGFFGTLRYASPEQIRNEEPLSTASDVYSLGVLLYELLTGHYPFQKWSASFLDLSKAICEQNPDRPSTAVGRCEEVRSSAGESRTLTPETVSATRGSAPGPLKRRLTGDLDKIVLKALHKDPAQRYSSADELSDDLGRHLDGLPVSVQEPTFSYQLGKFFQRHTAQVVTGAGLVLMIVAFGFFATWLWQKEKEAKEDRERALMVSDYLVELFTVDNPGTEGAAVSARELLDTGLAEVEQAQKMAGLSDAERDRLASQVPSDLPGLMDAFGWAYYGLGAYEDADKLLSDGLDRRRSSDSQKDDLAVHLLHLAAARSALGRGNETVELRREALDVLRSGEVDDLRLSQVLSQMGVLLRRRGDLEAAVDVLAEALAMTRRVEGDRNAGFWLVLNNLGAALADLGRYHEAESAYREALALKADRYGEGSPELEKEQNNLAVVLRDLGLLDPGRRGQAWLEAEDLFRESLAHRRRLYAEGDPRIAVVLNNMASLLLYRGARAEAEEMFDGALEIYRTSRGDDDYAVGVVLRNRALLYQAMGRNEAAEEDARQAVAILVAALGPDHWRRADAESVLGGCLLDLGRIDEAAPLLERSLPDLEAVKEEGDRVVWEARQRLQRLHELRAANPSE